MKFIKRVQILLILIIVLAHCPSPSDYFIVFPSTSNSRNVSLQVVYNIKRNHAASNKAFRNKTLRRDFSVFQHVLGRTSRANLSVYLTVCTTNTLAACRGRADNAAYVSPGNKLWEMSV